jgi:type I restriction enzyme S subunit
MPSSPFLNQTGKGDRMNQKTNQSATLPPPVVRLEEVVTFNQRRPPKNLTLDTPVAHVVFSGLLVASAAIAPEIRRLGDVQTGYYNFHDGDILVSADLIKLQEGRVVQARITQKTGYCSKKLYVIQPDPARLDARFLMYFLRRAQIRLTIARHLKHETDHHPPALEFLKTLPITLPPLKEQQRLVQALDTAFNACAVRRRDIAELNNKKQQLFANLFGDAATIFTAWTWDTLGANLDYVISGSRHWRQHMTSKGAFLFRHCNLGENEIIPNDTAYVTLPSEDAVNTVQVHFDTKRTQVMPGDVLMSTMTRLGRSALMPADIGRAYVYKGVAILRTSTVEPAYLAAYLCSQAGIAEIDRLKHAGMTPTLNNAAIAALRLPLPPRALQRQFALQIGAIERDRDTTFERLTQDQAQFILIEQRAFGGLSQGVTAREGGLR